MFELFIALIGGLYFAVRISSDRAGVRSAQKSAAEKSARSQAWKATVVDQELERQIKSSMNNPAERAGLVKRLIAYKEKYPDFCRNVCYYGQNYGWCLVKDDMVLSPKCVDLLMFTYGKCSWYLAFNLSLDAQHESMDGILERDDRLTFESARYVFTHQIPVL